MCDPMYYSNYSVKSELGCFLRMHSVVIRDVLSLPIRMLDLVKLYHVFVK